MQHIAVKVFEMKFDFGFKYEHFSEPIVVTGFLRLHKIVRVKGVKLTDKPVHSLIPFKYLHWRARWFFSAYDYVY